MSEQNMKLGEHYSFELRFFIIIVLPPQFISKGEKGH